ncbi:hypothetical protein [Maribacter sp. 2210JD10-5]|uniref:hypothetical protein n=1 Tax=Maribacter sp. 2210JD10-5 TaxID=3386272 RepID=UPI0039BCC803
MKQLLILLFLLTANQSFAQKATLLITNTETQKQKLIEERKRIRITKSTGEKFQGRFWIIDENTIVLDGVEINLSEIIKIRRHPLFNTIFIKSNLIHIGSLGMFFGILGTGLSGEGGILVGGAAVLAAGIYGAIKSPNLNKGYNINRKWRFEIAISPSVEQEFSTDKNKIR